MSVCKCACCLSGITRRSSSLAWGILQGVAGSVLGTNDVNVMRIAFPWSSELTAAYATLNLCLHLGELFATLLSTNSTTGVGNTDFDAKSRALLQVLTAVSVLPAAILPTPESMSSRRAPVLATFLIALALLVDAVLRLIAGVQALVRGGVPGVVVSPLPLLVAQCVLHLALLVATQMARGFGSAARARLAQMKGKKHLAAVGSWDGGAGSKSGGTAKDSAEDMAAKAGTMAGLRLHALSALAGRVAAVAARNASAPSFASAYSTGAASLTAVLAWPVAMETARILLQAAPASAVQSIRSRRDQVLAIDGVVDCSNVHIWEETAGIIVGTLCVAVHPSVSKSVVLRRAISAFDGLVDDLTVQVENWRGS